MILNIPIGGDQSKNENTLNAPTEHFYLLKVVVHFPLTDR